MATTEKDILGEIDISGNNTSSISPDLFDILPRAVPDNPYNYTEMELVRREQTLKAMAKDWPRLPRKWLEWTFDSIDRLPQEEQDAICNGAWDEMKRKPVEYQGVKKSVEHLGTWEVTDNNPELPYTINP
tara:strand:+ start:76 stop:465 length:390 start_codon:yes stop_codon:yes gene_type:complete